MVKIVAGLLAGSFVVLPVLAQSDHAPQAAAASQSPAAEQAVPVSTGTVSAAPVHKTSPYRQQKITNKAKNYYAGVWGVDRFRVNYTASGNLIRFSYRVSDAELAKPLAEKAATPYMVGLKSRAVLQVPVMDKVGMLRQASKPEVGKEYWMVFSNKGNLVRPGDRVNVVIGSFHADGLMVE